MQRFLVAAIQLGLDLLRRGDQLVSLGAGDLFAALRFDGVDEGTEGIARGAVIVHVRVHQDTPLRSPGFRMWLMIVIPTTPRAICLFDPPLLRSVLDVAIAEENIGTAPMTSARQPG